MFQIGDRVIWKPIDYRDHSQDINHRWYGAVGTVTKLCRFYACIALDNFPEVNHREVKNHFWVDFEELEQVRQT